MIGSLGEIVFTVSNELIKTFRDLNISRKANYSEHAIHGKTGLLEFTSFNAATATFMIRFDYSLGVKPYEELQALRKIYSEHQAVPLILGGELIGDGAWVIEDYEEKLEEFTNEGQLISCDVNIRLREYIIIDEEEER